MFFFVAVTDDTYSLGFHKFQYFPCCRQNSVIAEVTCTSRKFIFFFIPLFQFGKRYFVSCPRCGSIFEMDRKTGRQLEKNPSAEINPECLHQMSTGHPTGFCPNCGAQVDPWMRYCPSCGRKL